MLAACGIRGNISISQVAMSQPSTMHVALSIHLTDKTALDAWILPISIPLNNWLF